jgi:mycothiol synthase
MKTSTFTLRAPGDDDIAGIVALQSVADVRSGDSWTTTAEDVLHEWRVPGFDRDTMVRVAEINGEIVGSFTLSPGSDRVSRSRGFVHPDHRGAGIGSMMLRWAVETARARGVRQLFTHSSEQDSFAMIEHAGFVYARTFMRMMNRTPTATPKPEWPDGTRLVELSGKELIGAVADALDGSFVDHWNFQPTDREELAHDLADAGEDPSLWFVAFGGDQVAGCNLCHLKTKDGVKRGHIGPIGTTRAFRGIGLGRALLRHGLLELVARGAIEVGLGVDSKNPSGAVGLYERNGFEHTTSLRVFSIDF